MTYTPGVYDIPEADYFSATGVLSCSGAKLLLPPNCPALFRYRQDHPEHKKAWDFGSAAHRLVLGQGADFVIIDAENYRTKAAQQARDEARAHGAAPVLPHEHAQVLAMAEAIRRHPIAGPLLDPARGGQPERSLFWEDEQTGVPRRCRVDWLPEAGRGRYVVTDYKTCEHADQESVTKAIGNYGYYQQDRWYLDGVRALGLDDDPAFVFVFQEKNAPYLVNVAQIDAPEDWAKGDARNRHAIERFRDCTETGVWPGYEADTADGITYITLPPWAARAPEVSAA